MRLSPLPDLLPQSFEFTARTSLCFLYMRLIYMEGRRGQNSEYVKLDFIWLHSLTASMHQPAQQPIRLQDLSIFAYEAEIHQM